MVRINNVNRLDPQQLGAVIRLQQVNDALALNNLRISTQRRINSAKDDPAGLVAVANLQAEIDSLNVTTQSLSRASSLLNSADTTAGQIVSNLMQARSLVLAAADGSLSAAEKAGKQAELDTVLRAVSTLAGTEFNGQRLLDGSSGYQVTGVNASQIKSVTVLDRQNSNNVTVNVNVTTAATKATNSYISGALGSDTTLTITGMNGTASISLSSGASTSDIASAFNSVSQLTGVTATRIDGNQVDFASTEYGTSAKIAIAATSGSFATTTTGTTSGTNAIAVINGETVTGDGTTFTVNTLQSLISFSVAPSASGTLSSFTVSGEGLEFLIGEKASATASIGLPNLNAGALNSIFGTLTSVMSGGANDLNSGNLANTLEIVDAALATATAAQSRIGAFQKYTITSAANVAAKTKENVASTLADRDGFDLAEETSMLANNQLLQAASIQSLQIFRQSSLSILSLLSSAAFPG